MLINANQDERIYWVCISFDRASKLWRMEAPENTIKINREQFTLEITLEAIKLNTNQLFEVQAEKYSSTYVWDAFNMR